VFLQNQNFIQTEVRLVPPKKSTASGGGGGKGGKGKSKGKGGGKSSGGRGARNGDGEQLEFDYSYMDNHHRAVLSSLVLSHDLIAQGQRVQPIGSDSRAAKGFVVGLGGGAFPMCLQRYLPGLTLHVCDLDPDMEGIATRQFGFKKNARTSTIVGEGMALIYGLRDAIRQRGTLPSMPPSTAAAGGAVDAEMTEQLDFIFIDADSKDPSLGLSAPPKTFITPTALSAMHGVMRPGGLLAINVAARSAGLLDEFVRSIHAVFMALDAVDDHNIANPTAPYSESDVEKLVERLASGGGNSEGKSKEQQQPFRVVGHIDALLSGNTSSSSDNGLTDLENTLKKLTLDGPVSHAAYQGRPSTVVRQRTPIGGSRVFMLRPATDTANVVVLVLKGDHQVRQRHGTSYEVSSIAAGASTSAPPSVATSSSTTKGKGKGPSAAASQSPIVDPWLPEARTAAARERSIEEWLKVRRNSSHRYFTRFALTYTSYILPNRLLLF
jgi:hypothetical protein